MTSPPHGLRVSELIDDRQSNGSYTITIEEVEREAVGSTAAHRSALRRLKEKGRIVSPRRGFFVLVPVEYRSTGAPPASWFIDDLMRYLDQPYYVGLLSAAAIHGAAHQHPQVFQVMTTRPVPPMTAGRVQLEFHRRRSLDRVPTRRTKTETGSMVVSTPESTLFDLLRHVHAVGHLNNVATVLLELAEVMEPAALEKAAEAAHITEVQRAGYLLDFLGEDELAQSLQAALAGRRIRAASLRPDVDPADSELNARWQLVINENVEPDR